MKEKDMYGVFRQSFDYLFRTEKKSHYFKFPDMNLVQEKFDAYCLYDKEFFGIEYKLNKNKNKFCFASIFKGCEHEIKGLTYITKCGGTGIVIIKFEINGKVYWYDINFINKYYDKDFMIGEGNELKKIKDEVGRYIYDIKPMLIYAKF